jgi:hypothetical protein
MSVTILFAEVIGVLVAASADVSAVARAVLEPKSAVRAVAALLLAAVALVSVASAAV